MSRRRIRPRSDDFARLRWSYGQRRIGGHRVQLNRHQQRDRRAPAQAPRVRRPGRPPRAAAARGRRLRRHVVSARRATRTVLAARRRATLGARRRTALGARRRTALGARRPAALGARRRTALRGPALRRPTGPTGPTRACVAPPPGGWGARPGPARCDARTAASRGTSPPAQGWAEYPKPRLAFFGPRRRRSRTAASMANGAAAPRVVDELETHRLTLRRTPGNGRSAGRSWPSSLRRAVHPRHVPPAGRSGSPPNPPQRSPRAATFTIDVSISHSTGATSSV
jgi:hypothetical protein